MALGSVAGYPSALREPTILVYFNYYVDAARWPRMLARLENELGHLPCRFTNNLVGDDYAQVQLLVNKTRELGDQDLKRFPGLRGILLWGTEKWMLSLEQTASSVNVRLLDVDRGSDVAEHAVALLLAGLKGLHHRMAWGEIFSPRNLYRWCCPQPASESVGAHNWMGRQAATLYRKRAGIVGYGLIGRQIHRRLQGFDCQVFYNHVTRYSPRIEQDLRMCYLSIAEIFAECDIVFVQLPLTTSTENLIGRQILKGAKPGLALINCGRAGVISESDLYHALRAGQIGFYGADVFWHEPAAPWNRFSRLPNVLITPHMAESVPGQPDLFAKVIEQIDIFCRSSG